MRRIHLVLFTTLSLCSGLVGAWLFQRHSNNQQEKTNAISWEIPLSRVSRSAEMSAGNLPDFVKASEITTPTVVFIKTESQYQRKSTFGWFFEFDPFGSIGKVNSTGSGVIISPDGYIVTNHHVIQGADKIEVVRSGRKSGYVASVIGSDPSSDLALLKIEANNLPYIEPSNSDDLRIGEWVLAVGNPFNLTSTVTAGIVSAKGRNINIVNSRFPIESFIQTDAAINPGNSGGALVNLEGKLVGVNTAIASETGSYVGYGFAIPSNIVMKIIKDLKEYGQLQRGFSGIEVRDQEGVEQASANLTGAVVSKILQGYPNASKFEIGDLITKVDEFPIESKAAFDERMAYYRPGDKIRLGIIRNNKKIEMDIVLVNKEGTTDLIKRVSLSSDILGADFEYISKLERDLYRIEFGVKVSNIRKGLIKNMNLPEGFIFTAVNGKRFQSLEAFVSYLEEIKGSLRVEGVRPDGGKLLYNFNVY